MDPKPDYGLDSYKGSGKLKNKVSNGQEAYAIICQLGTPLTDVVMLYRWL